MSGTNDPVLAKLERLEKILEKLQTGVNDLRSDLRSDINDLRSDLRSDINVLRSDIKDLSSTTNEKFEMLGRSNMTQNANHS